MSDLSPYPLVRTERGEDVIYTFTTDNRIDYEIVFKSDSDYFPVDDPIAPLTFSFILTRVNEKAGGNDPKIKLTVIYALRAVFDTNPQFIITYQCSTESRQERARAVYFQKWFNECGDTYCRIDYADSGVYATAIYKNDHPMENGIKAAFSTIFQDK